MSLARALSVSDKISVDSDVLGLSATDILSLYKRKELSPVEVAKSVLAQIDRVNPSLNAFALVAEEADVLRRAAESEARWLKATPMGVLDGVPVTIKDTADVQGWPTREGSKTMPDTPVERDSPFVARLREVGAVFVGKTTLPEFGHKGTTDSPLMGITRNPWDPEKTCGGSSGGAAVAAATGMGFLHQGSDGGGSIRIPASFCGVFGHKPSSGLVPAWPPSLFSSIAVSGPITRKVEDAALMLEVMSLPDKDDWNSVPYQKRDFVAGLKMPLNNLRIAYARTMNNVPVDEEVAASVEKAVKAMDGTLGKVEEITLDLPGMSETFDKHWKAVARWLLNRAVPNEKHKDVDPYLLEWARRGAEMSLDEYMDAELERMVLGNKMRLVLQEYDVLVMPTLPVAAFDAGKDMPLGADGAPWEDWTPFTYPANMGRFPASSMPCGMTSGGLPVGIQILSNYLQDDLVLNVSYQLESILGFEGWR